MTERGKPTYPTEKQIIERSLSSPRMCKLFEGKRVRFFIPSFFIQTSLTEETVIPQKQPQEMPPYIIFKLPEDGLTEIDFLGLSNRARNALARSGVKKISQLISLCNKDSPWGIEGLGEKSQAEVRTKLEEFRETLIEKHKENPGKPVIIDTLPSSF